MQDVMTRDLLVGKNGISLEEAYEKLAKSRKSKLPICDCEGNLVSLITLADLKKKKDFPLASINPQKNQLMVGAGVSTRPEDKVRIEKLINQSRRSKAFWKLIETPCSILTPRYGHIAVPFNSYEIAIFGGVH